MEVKIDKSNGLSGVEIETDSIRTSLNYGIRPVYSDLTTVLEITTDRNLLFNSTCRCTVSTPQKTEKGYILKVKYDAENRAPFGKTLVVLDLKDNSKVHEIILRGLIK